MTDIFNDTYVRLVVPAAILLLYFVVFYKYLIDGIRVKILPAEDVAEETEQVILVPCENGNAVGIHACKLTTKEQSKFSGFPSIKKTLCDRHVGWDNRFTLKEVTCSVCLEEVKRIQETV